MHRTSLMLALVLAVAGAAVSSGQGFTPTPPLPLNTDFATDDLRIDYSPEIASDGLGNWIAVWHFQDFTNSPTDTDYEIAVSRSFDHGVTWSPRAKLNTNGAMDAGNDRDPTIVTDGHGNWIAAWRSDDTLGGTIGADDDILVSRSTNNGATWSAPVALNTNAGSDSGDDTEPRLITNGIGNWIAVWESTDGLGGMIGADPDVLVSRSSNNGVTWTSPAPLNATAFTDTAHDRRVQLATDGAGLWIAAWDSWNTLGGTIGLDWDILIARSTDNGATWSVPVALSPNAATDGVIDDFDPSIATDRLGNWVAAWLISETFDAIDPDLVISRSTNNGTTWSAPVPITSSEADELDIHVLTDRTGNWMVMWTTQDSLNGTIGTDLDLLFSRSTNNGLAWTSPATLNSNAPTDSAQDDSLAVAVDENSNWIAVWRGLSVPDDPDIHFCRWSLAVPDPDDIYVDFSKLLNGPGTPSAPLNNLTGAVAIANNGATIRLAPGSSSETFAGINALGTANRPMTLVRNGGGISPVRIGVP